MSRIFLRTYVTVALVSVVALGVTHVGMSWQLRRVMDERLAVALEGPVLLVRDRLAQHAAQAGPQAPHNAPHADPRPGRGGPGRGPWMGAARQLERELGLPVRVERIAALGLDAAAQAKLEAGDYVTQRTGGTRQTIVGIDPRLALVIGPTPDRLPRRALWVQGTMLVVLLLAVMAALWWAQRPLAQRLSQITQAAARLGHGDRAARAHILGNDEVGQLGVQFDQMADQVSALLEQREELLRSASHELRTPLARLVWLREELEDQLTDPAARAQLTRMQVSMEEMQRLVEELLTLTRLDANVALVQTPVDLVALAHERAELLPQDTLVLNWEVAAPQIEVLGDRRLLARVLDNLLQNASRHARTGLWIGLTVEAAADGTPGWVQLCVDDDGPGVPAAQREAIFAPFVRLQDAARRGQTGLGLAIVARAVAAHRGTVVCEAAPAGGARFRVRLPIGGIS